MAPKSHITRRRMLTATGAGMAAGLAGCTGNGGQQETETTASPGGTDGGTGSNWIGELGDTGNEVHILTDYSNDAWQGIWENQLVPAFQDELGISSFNAEYVGFQGTGEQRFTTLLQSGQAPESFTGGIGQIGDLFARGDAIATTNAVDQIKEGSGDTVGAALTYKGHNFVVPHGKYTSSIHYREDILEQLGLEPPETLSQYLENAKVIDESDEVEARGATSPAPKAGQSTSWFELLLLAHGAWKYQWNDDETEAEIWFPKEEVVASLEYAKELAQYSPDPASVNWGSTLQYWAGNRVAQMYQLNAWGAGVAASAGNTEIGANTGIVPFPTVEGTEPFARGAPGFDGHPAVGLADNVPGLLKALTYMYEDPARAAPYYADAEPTRFIPAYRDIMEVDAYTNADIFQEVPNLLELNKKARDEIAPLEPSAKKIVFTPSTMYTDSFPIDAEMVNQVVVADRDPEAAYEDAKERYETRLEEGKQESEGAYPDSG